MFFKPAYIKAAQERARLLKKVYHYRYSQVSLGDRELLTEYAGRISSAIKLKDKRLAETLVAESEPTLKRVGGHYHKHYHLHENVETLVVAAILAIGIRMYFLQPFKIPTNSMWPTYHGMTFNLRGEGNLPGSPLESFARLVFNGTTYHEAKTPVAGRLTFPIFNATDREKYGLIAPYRVVSKKLFGIFPLKQRQYVFYVGETPVTLEVPLEFGFDKVLLQKFFQTTDAAEPSKNGRYDTGLQLKAGDTILAFEIETGDMLFVDRFSYHFRSPKVGEPIVFRTRNIEGLRAYNHGMPDDKYYIKRLVGLQGDKLEIKAGALQRNNQPIAGSPIFELNNTRQRPYDGYENVELLSEGQAVVLGQKEAFAMGDNSDESLDSRYWGSFPQREIIGRAVFIYYPFSWRWGASR